VWIILCDVRDHLYEEAGVILETGVVEKGQSDGLKGQSK
jgi:hypothetical protein